MLRLLREFDRVCRILDLPYILYAGTLLGAVRHRGFIPWDDDLDVMMLRKDYARFLSEAPKLLDPTVFFLQGEFSDHWPMFFSKLRLQNTACLERYRPRDEAHHQGIYMDIFPCDNGLNGVFARKLQFFASKIVIAKALYCRGYETKNVGKRLLIQVCRCLPSKPFWRLATMGREDSAWVNTFFSCGKAFCHNSFPRSWITHREMGVFEGMECPIPAHWDEMLRMLYGDYMTLPDEAQRAVKQHAVLVDLDRPWTDYTHFQDGMEFDVLTQSIR